MARTQPLILAAAPPPWNSINTHVELWHGCLRSAAQNIQANGIDLTRSRIALDFGPGFYTTTSRNQAESWAWKQYLSLMLATRAATRPAVLRFRVPLDGLAQLESLMFVRGDPSHDAFWSFVHHCRLGTTGAPRRHLHPSRLPPSDDYDVVCGPLAAVWPPDGRIAIPNSDQFSFHTPAGVAILAHVIAAGSPNFRVYVL